MASRCFLDRSNRKICRRAVIHSMVISVASSDMNIGLPNAAWFLGKRIVRQDTGAKYSEAVVPRIELYFYAVLLRVL